MPYLLIEFIPALKYRPWIAAPLTMVCYCLVLVGTIWLALRFCRKQGFRPLIHIKTAGHFFSELGKSVLYSFPLLFFIGVVVLIFQWGLGLERKPEPFIEFLSHGQSNWMLLFFMVTVFTIAPVAEELFFRGFFYNALRTRFTVVWAIFLQAFVFALWHQYNALNSISVFILGLAFAYFYERKRNLLRPMALHCVVNGIAIIPLLVLGLMNLHNPASSWEEAKLPPQWLSSTPAEYVEKMPDGLQQVEYAKKSWGSLGTRQWKKEANAFLAVHHWFPEDEQANAKAILGTALIYQTLQDHRRAVLAAKVLLSQYPEYREECASAIILQGWSYYLLQDFELSRTALEALDTHYSDVKKFAESAIELKNWLDSVESL